MSLGALTLETNNEMYASFHSINGIDDTFSWGGKNLNKYMLVIKPGNSGYFYDFTDAKKGEKRESQKTLKCNRQTYELSSKEVYNYFVSLIKDMQTVKGIPLNNIENKYNRCIGKTFGI